MRLLPTGRCARSFLEKGIRLIKQQHHLIGALGGAIKHLGNALLGVADPFRQQVAGGVDDQLTIQFACDVLRQPGLASAGLAVETQCRSEEHTSELQSLMRSSYAVLCLKKKNTQVEILLYTDIIL